MHEFRTFEKWFPLSIQKNKEIKLFCFPHAGGSANVFRDWVKFAQNTDVDVIPVELPGRATRLSEEREENIDVIVEEVAFCINQIINNNVFYLYGHSLGAIIAFQVAYVLEKKYKKKAKMLIVSGRQAPFMEDATDFRTWMGEGALIQEMRRAQTVEEMLLENEAYCEFFLPIIMSDYRMNENYHYCGEMLSLPIMAYSSVDDFGAEPEIMINWKHVTNAKFHLYKMDGNHFFVYEKGKDFFDEILQRIEVTKYE